MKLIQSGSKMDIYAIAREIIGKSIRNIIDVNPHTNEFTIVFEDGTCLEIKEQSSQTIIDVQLVY